MRTEKLINTQSFRSLFIAMKRSSYWTIKEGILNRIRTKKIISR